jgi:pyruvate dehydrogenase E1 component beta subunit
VNQIFYGHSFNVPKLDDFVLPISKARVHNTGTNVTDTVIEPVKKTNRLATVEEGFPQSSARNFIANQVSQPFFYYLDVPVITIAGKDVSMPYAANLEKLALPNVAEVVEAVEAVTSR